MSAEPEGAAYRKPAAGPRTQTLDVMPRPAGLREAEPRARDAGGAASPRRIAAGLPHRETDKGGERTGRHPELANGAGRCAGRQDAAAQRADGDRTGPDAGGRHKGLPTGTARKAHMPRRVGRCHLRGMCAGPARYGCEAAAEARSPWPYWGLFSKGAGGRFYEYSRRTCPTLPQANFARERAGRRDSRGEARSAARLAPDGTRRVRRVAEGRVRRKWT